MKTIIVDLNPHDSRASVLNAAIAVGQQHGAHVVGLYVKRSRLIHTGLYGFGGAYFDRDVEAAEGALARKAQMQFDLAMSGSGLTHEIRIVDTEGVAPMDLLTHHARLSDFVVTGCDLLKGDERAWQTDALGQLVIGCGRPVLVIPELTENEFKLGDSVIAWDGSKEAARAVFDALPLLKEAAGEGHETVLASVNFSKERMDALRQSGARLIDTLGRHGVKAHLRQVPGRGRDDKAIRQLAEDASLLVMGAYHHTRLREAIFGGVTSHLLGRPPCPILLSC